MSKDMDYKKAGVDITAGDMWAKAIGNMVKTQGINDNVAAGVGGFSGLYRINDHQMLAACADGVGTKMELAMQAGDLSGLGQDLVAMNVNDLICCGAKPLFFLDYLACGELRADYYGVIIEDILNACNMANCALLGGETAEMPGIYPKGGFDLAGFSVGIVDQDKIINGNNIKSGDMMIALPSSGVHSNGFSLVREVVKHVGFDQSPIDALLEPTKIYVPPVQKLMKHINIKAMAHITGGGLYDNIVRSLAGFQPQIDWNSWERPFVFDWLCQHVKEQEMRKVFNLGIGFVIVVDQNDGAQALEILSSENAFICGEVGPCES